ncbi:MAG: FtsX-like permease family protein [Bacteroidetes bacterium]|nr:FtsX-like permease family protein [Bacteroidota bacterium]
MKIAFQLAWKNLIGAGLRTWLNVGVLAFSFLVIVFYNAMLDGWNHQAKFESIKWEYAHGQLINENYDPYDPFTVQDGHGIFPGKTADLCPILIRQGTLYPNNRMLTVALMGIDTSQRIVSIPVEKLKSKYGEFPVIMGRNMANSLKVKVGDQILLRWRDKNGTFDATEVTVSGIFKTDVPTVDNGKVWMSIQKLWEITDLNHHATYFVANQNFKNPNIPGWKYKSQEALLQDITNIIAMKKTSSSIIYILLLSIALLAIFDTQVLSVFRRQKEIGTYVALGMTRTQVVGIFTVEGSMYSVFAIIISGIIGIPLFAFLAKTGISFPTNSQDVGFAMAETIYPIFGIKLILGSILLVMVSATIVSFLPTRKITKMNPVDALKGKLQ